MENATEKQVNFIKTLAVRVKKPEPDFQYLTKDGAKTLIDDWLGNEKPKEIQKVPESKGNGEIYLTVESVRSNALNSAIEYARMFNEAKEVKLTPTSEQIVAIAAYFEKYILNGVQEK